MKSNILKELYKGGQAATTPKDLAFVDRVYAHCEKNYDQGGDAVVECYTPEEIVAEFQTLGQIKAFIRARYSHEGEIMATAW